LSCRFDLSVCSLHTSGISGCWFACTSSLSAQTSPHAFHRLLYCTAAAFQQS
jgi:hypothetical protein